MTSDPNLPRALADRAAICDLLTLYVRGIDRLDGEAMKPLFHADASLAIAGYESNAREFCGVIQAMLRELIATHHQLGLPHIVLDGRQAHVETYFTAIHRIGPDGWSPHPKALPGEDMIMRGRYIDQMEDRGDGWAIARRDVVVDWVRFDAGNDRQLLDDPAFLPASRRDRTDLAYAREAA